MAKPSPMGMTFAERVAAAAGKASFDDPTPKPGEVEENSTFAERAAAAKRGKKAVQGDDAENKAVSSGESKAPAKKAAAKKA